MHGLQIPMDLQPASVTYVRQKQFWTKGSLGWYSIVSIVCPWAASLSNKVNPMKKMTIAEKEGYLSIK